MGSSIPILRPRAASTATVTSAPGPVRLTGTTSAFQTPPSVSAASGPGNGPSSERANRGAAAGSLTASRAWSSPEASQGAWAATHRSIGRSSCRRGAEPIASTDTTARQVASPALMLRLPTGTATSSHQGHRPVLRQHAAPTSTHGRAAYPTSTGQCPSTSRSTTSGFHCHSVTAASRATRPTRPSSRSIPREPPTSAPSRASF